MPPTTALCTSCLRTTLRPTTLSSRVLRSSSRAYRMTAATPSQTLYLDFLAPSATRTSPKTLPRTPYPQTWHRNYAVAAAAPEQSSSSSVPYNAPTRAILNPRTAEDGTPMSISISPRAVNRLSAIAASDQNPDTALRVTVESGGCHGFQYLMSLTDLSTSPAAEDDTVFEGDKGAKVVIDESSLELLNGSTVDYTMELIGSQFKVTGIPGATSSCGCGTSFDIQL